MIAIAHEHTRAYRSTNLVDRSLLGVPEVLKPIVSKPFRVHPLDVHHVPDLAHKVQLVVEQAAVHSSAETAYTPASHRGR